MPDPLPPAPRVNHKLAKLILVAVLGGLALFLQVTVWTLQVHLDAQRAAIASRKATLKTSETNLDALSEEARELIKAEKEKRTVLNSVPTLRTSLHSVQQRKADTGSSVATSAAAYWRQAVGILEWDAVLFDPADTATMSSSLSFDAEHVNVTAALTALKRAAQLGHPAAQHAYANALAAGFWPLTKQPDDSTLQVHDTMDPVDPADTATAYSYWHMAAVSGHVESAMILAARLEAVAPKQDNCWERVLYYRAAADAIIDDLETGPHRGKVAPPMDKHILHHVHLHGGTGAKLDYFNKPDETAEALQYYHVKAVHGTGSGPSADAAFTLGKLYQYGLRGVSQNLTLAAQYYEMAALQGDWEAAGKAGELHLWGMGVPQDAYKAHRLFRLGMPVGVQGCHDRLKKKLKQGKSDPNSVYICDDSALNGMGLIKLLGLPMIVPIDREDAIELFELAKDQGNRDANYNLAMIRLGWKTHFQKIGELSDTGLSPANELYGSEHSAPTRAEYQAILTELTTAAVKGHLQAKHRLAMMYTEGIKIPAKPGMANIVKDGLVQVVARDCEKSLKHFKAVVDTASPQRSRRLRKAYKDYVAGDTANSLRNYLAAAETGSELAQTNAAFLMERGECLGLSRIDCAKASVRLWKAAAAKGSIEASLRVGDFYYYGRFREDSKPIGPFGWSQYILYPEEFLPGLWDYFRDKLHSTILKLKVGEDDESSQTIEDQDENVCIAGSEEGTCAAPGVSDPPEAANKLDEDLKMSSHYYRLAAEKSSSPRANYNLGFLYEWGLGLKQDFPLAKRHYDLAVSGSSAEADVTVSLALSTLSIHEAVVKFLRSASLLPGSDETAEASTGLESEHSNKPMSPSAAERGGEPVPSPRKQGKTTKDVLLSHLLSWESLLILVLTIVLWLLLRNRRTQR